VAGGAPFVDPFEGDAGQFGLVGQDADGLAGPPVMVAFVGHMAVVDCAQAGRVAHRDAAGPLGDGQGDDGFGRFVFGLADGT
jgi:hypothetical protein